MKKALTLATIIVLFCCNLTGCSLFASGENESSFTTDSLATFNEEVENSSITDSSLISSVQGSTLIDWLSSTIGEEKIQAMVEDVGLTTLSKSNCGFQGEDTPMDLVSISIESQQMQDEIFCVYCHLSLGNDVMTAEVYYELNLAYSNEQGWRLDSWQMYQPYQLRPKQGVSEDSVALAVYEEFDVSSSGYSFEVTESDLDLSVGEHNFTGVLNQNTNACSSQQTVWVMYYFDQEIGQWNLFAVNPADDFQVTEWHPHGSYLLNINTFYVFFSIDAFDANSATAQISSVGSVWESGAAYYAMNHYYENGVVNNSDVVQTVTVDCTIKENEIEFEPFRVNDLEGGLAYSIIHLVVMPRGVYYYVGDNTTREDSKLFEADSFDTLEYLNTHS